MGFLSRESYNDRGDIGKNKPKLTLKKYYMEVVGATKELYTVKAHNVERNEGCYVFILDNEVVASYPIARTIVKSIEEKPNE